MLITSTISGTHPDARLCPAFSTEADGRFYQEPFSIQENPGNQALTPCSSLGSSETELGLLPVGKVG